MEGFTWKLINYRGIQIKLASPKPLFFDDLDIPKPDINLEVGSSSHAVQTAKIMMKLKPILEEKRPDWVVVVGDVKSTLAATVTASKLG